MVSRIEEKKIRITASVFGRFHMFDLAGELEKQKVLNQFFTTYTQNKVRQWKIPKDKVTTFPILEIANRLHRLMFGDYRHRIQYHKKIYDFLISKLLSSKSNVYICWAGPNHKSITKAKKNGCKVILESGSTHIQYQEKILAEEFSNNNARHIRHTKTYINDAIKSIKLADKVMVPSSFVKRTYIECGVPEHKILVNPYGVDLKKFTETKKNDHVFRFIFCGRLSLRKGTHFLLKAFTELDLKDAELLLIGPIDPEMAPIIKNYSRSNIKYMGVIKQDNLSKHFSQGNVFVLPSLEEGLALVQAQAMACGLPLICTTNTGGEDLISRNGVEGFVIPIRNHKALMAKMAYMYLNKEKCAEMGIAAKNHISNNFTWEVYGKRYFKYIKNILNE